VTAASSLGHDPAGPQLDCPVCPRGALPAGTLVCPNCETALTPLWRLRELGTRYYNDGLDAARRGDAEAAIRKLCCALELGADEISTRLLLGKLLWRTGQREQAAAHWRAVEFAAPDRAECRPLLRMAQRARQLRRLAVAVALLLGTAAAAQLWSGSARSGSAAPAPAAMRAAAAPLRDAELGLSAFSAVASARQCLEHGGAAAQARTRALCWVR
jgi:hypothetical protein